MLLDVVEGGMIPFPHSRTSKMKVYRMRRLAADVARRVFSALFETIISLQRVESLLILQ